MQCTMNQSLRSGTRQACVNPWCRQSFEITPDDLAFYEKVSPVFNGKKELIPPPTLCPECRQQRRLAFRNERKFYRRTCDVSGQDIISIYSPDNPCVVYNQENWWGDGWDSLQYGRPFDFSRPFFEQFANLWLNVPMMALCNIKCENSLYNNFCSNLKNSYLCIASDNGQNNLYSYVCEFCNDCADCSFIQRSELCYECLDCINAYQCTFSEKLESCTDCHLSSDLMGCRRCIGCHGLRRKELYMFNEKVTQEEWNERTQQLFSSSRMITQMRENSGKVRLRIPYLYAKIVQCEGCTGDHLYRCKNAVECFDVSEAEDMKYVIYSPMKTFRAHDLYAGGECELVYEYVGGGYGIFKSSFLHTNANGLTDSYYCVHCANGCSNLFGCIGLKHKQYCILNKQYTKEEYERLVPKIIEKMMATPLRSHDGSFAGYEWGEFFPVSMSPFAYNETVAQEYFPLTKEEVLKRGWKWRDEVDEIPKVEKIIPAEGLPDSIDDIPDDILNWAIKCEVTGRPFRIVKQELAFYRKMRLPVPRFHPDERHRRRMAMRNPRKLWKRSCMKCGKGIETTYSPERPEIVHCESCYLQAVY